MKVTDPVTVILAIAVTSTPAVTPAVSITDAKKEEESGNGEVIAWDTVDDADTPHKEEAIADDWEQVDGDSK